MMRLLKTEYSFPILLLTGVFLVMTQHADADVLKGLQANLPSKIMDWSAEPGDRIFDRNTIFDYINGGAEVYKAYNMQQCLSRRYLTPDGPAIVLDIFDMGRSEDAFGVFTHDTNGEFIKLGQDARLQPGWLCFWKDRFFISLYTEKETPAARKAVRELGRQVAGQIRTEGPRPPILSELPPGGLQRETVRYLHDPVVLNYHYYLSDENLLNISKDTDVALASYQRDRESALLLLIKYPDPKTADRSLMRFLNHYLPDADRSDSALLENGKWASGRMRGNLVAIVLEAGSRDFADRLLIRVFERK
ncbi:MAG: hypothetical protein H8E10_09535 [Desulfobacterales bacterium]|nr:hypothetical protein [Desulfobacterales bacterium]MBL7102021.1 hypothetical protein [Desulfobacteraceae bacterium]MBL7172763.1 hypothetical protein [Desulfobacteraceae bacterium]